MKQRTALRLLWGVWSAMFVILGVLFLTRDLRGFAALMGVGVIGCIALLVTED